jgi:hypothetical protein
LLHGHLTLGLAASGRDHDVDPRWSFGTTPAGESPEMGIGGRTRYRAAGLQAGRVLAAMLVVLMLAYRLPRFGTRHPAAGTVTGALDEFLGALVRRSLGFKIAVEAHVITLGNVEGRRGPLTFVHRRAFA